MDNTDDFNINFEEKLTDIFQNGDLYNHLNFVNDEDFNLKFNTLEEEKDIYNISRQYESNMLRSVSEIPTFTNHEEVQSFKNGGNHNTLRVDGISIRKTRFEVPSKYLRPLTFYACIRTQLIYISV